MNVSRCRFWFCSSCSGVIEKQELARRITDYSGPGEVIVRGTIECGHCHRVYQQQDVYSGKHDLPRQHWAQIQAKDGRPIELDVADAEVSTDTGSVHQPSATSTHIGSKASRADVPSGCCSVCRKKLPSGGPFITVVSQPDGFTTFKNLKDVWDDKPAMNKRVEDNGRQVCEACMTGVLPRWIKDAGNAGLMIATNQLARKAGPGELCPQCLEPASELIWGVLNDNSNLFDWFWWCTTCKGKWWYSPENLPYSRPPYRTAEQRRREEENARRERERREDERKKEDARRAEERRKEEARKAEEARVQEVKAKRQAAGQCENCGHALGFMDRLFKRNKHPACRAYTD